MNSILAAKENEVIEGYPFLNDNELSAELLNINHKQSLEEIDSFFNKLRTDFQDAIRDA